MQIMYKNAKVEKQFSSKYKKSWTYPKQVQVKLESAENFMSMLPDTPHSILKSSRVPEKMSGVSGWEIPATG